MHGSLIDQPARRPETADDLYDPLARIAVAVGIVDRPALVSITSIDGLRYHRRVRRDLRDVGREQPPILPVADQQERRAEHRGLDESAGRIAYQYVAMLERRRVRLSVEVERLLTVLAEHPPRLVAPTIIVLADEYDR